MQILHNIEYENNSNFTIALKKLIVVSHYGFNVKSSYLYILNVWGKLPRFSSLPDRPERMLHPGK
jgi:hypothetical protein